MPSDANLHVRIRLLGPLDLAVRGEQVVVPGPKRRATLAMLALAGRSGVRTTELIDALWPEGPPHGALGALQNHVSRIRAHLGTAADRLTVGIDGAYVLHLEPGGLDVQIARDGLDAARRIANDDPAAAAEQLSAVRELWRGRALAEFDDIPAIAASGVALEALRREVDLVLIRCALRAGDIDGALRAGVAAVETDPRSEELARRHMETLAAAGRPSDALDVGARLRRRLQEDLGVEPGIELDELERAIARGARRARSGPLVAGPVSDHRRDLVPSSVTTLVGREAELGAVRRLVDTERIVTILGAGGVGKTRLAADVARRHDDEVHWITLVSLADPDDLPRVLAQALGLDGARGDPLDACLEVLGGGERLLVLDNCEHVLEAAGLVIDRVIRSCPALTVLATSRQRLGLADECVVRLGPLAVPDATAHHPERAPALALFLDRARRARPDLRLDDRGRAAAVSIVRRLDGLPLAIELAASRLTTLDVVELRDRLDRQLDLFQGGSREPDRRHRTLRDTLAWSYDLVPSDRQRLLRHLAVFPDGIGLAAAERIGAEIGVDGDPAVALGHLVDASLLDAEMGDRTRYRMLESMRRFGLERLEAAGERDAAERRFLRWAEDFTEWIDAILHTPEEALADEQLRSELANLRAAWALALRTGALDAAIAIIVALDDVAQWRELPEVWAWADQLVDHAGLAEHPRRAAALATASDFAWLQGDLTGAAELAEAALECAADDDGRARALIAVSVVRLSQGEFAAAATLALQAADIARIPTHARMVAALATAYGGDVGAAARINVAVAPDAGITQRAEWEYTEGEIANLAGRAVDAEQHYRRAIDLASAVGSSFVTGIASVGLLTVLHSAGSTRAVLAGYREVLGYWQAAGNWIQVWTTLRNLADVLTDIGEADAAAVLRAAADRDGDAPAVGESARSPATIEPSRRPGDAASVPARDEAVALAFAVIDRQLRPQQ